jgi:hypothetical protein
MERDATDAAWHQQELDERRYHEELANDPDYLNWLESLNNQEGNDFEISSETLGRL